ncbi:Uncharacterised protein [Salmonella enterica subsp. enterica]|uniref:Uncharacterized protein n=1 Tax=Salmonella enterica I TaxID=59201 RepID=A0A447TQF2_SALET|nr:Uncharacterised protein [Salmonella enterica subsp. enterica]
MMLPMFVWIIRMAIFRWSVAYVQMSSSARCAVQQVDLQKRVHEDMQAQFLCLPE